MIVWSSETIHHHSGSPNSQRHTRAPLSYPTLAPLRFPPEGCTSRMHVRGQTLGRSLWWWMGTPSLLLLLLLTPGPSSSLCLLPTYNMSLFSAAVAFFGRMHVRWCGHPIAVVCLRRDTNHDTFHRHHQQTAVPSAYRVLIALLTSKVAHHTPSYMRISKL